MIDDLTIKLIFKAGYDAGTVASDMGYSASEKIELAYKHWSEISFSGCWLCSDPLAHMEKWRGVCPRCSRDLFDG